MVQNQPLLLVERILAKPAETFPLSLVEARHVLYSSCSFHACIILTGEFCLGFPPLSGKVSAVEEGGHRAIGETEESAVMARCQVVDLRVSSMIVSSRNLQILFYYSFF